MIRFDSKTRCYTDGKNYVHANVLRDYAHNKLGLKSRRGRFSKRTIAAYFLDVFGVTEEVAS